ncbi:MAG: exodeoxyribonuclease VII large subunit [Coxiellaceae bacterium]|nr:exodeoxyribonuclease VII large subunit [Coxiellaceae bacterium]
MTADIINHLETEIYTVAQFNHDSRVLLENTFGQIWITGEISNLARPASGHLYFTLKDEKAAVRCALFRNSRRNTPTDLDNGMQVIAHARVSLYEPRGDFQLIVNSLEPAGLGLLQKKFEQLKKQLHAEGLFENDRKQTIPSAPHTIGLITSPKGAAIHDVLKVLKRRHANTEVVIYPSLVQGEQAAGNICHMIELANQRQECDVILLTRGGGSLEDLWCFNEESVARAIAASDLPIVSAVGHEVDFTIADFVADLRAATPSAAAELLSPDQAALKRQLATAQKKLGYLLQQQLQYKQLLLDKLKARLPRPDAILQQQIQTVDHLQMRLQQAMQHTTHEVKQRLAYNSGLLNSLSPLNTLSRGYAIMSQGDKAISSVKQINKDQPLVARMHDGELLLNVKTS